MNERVMQFRIGMFVIVAGLVLTMMIVWFGESPSLLRDQVYYKVRYPEAPGVLEGVAVRKSGIRIGEVSAIGFDTRPNQPDGVMVTLALDRGIKLRKDTHPRISRSLIGDVTIEILPGSGEEITGASNPRDAVVIEGDVAPDPSKALAAATKAFEGAGETLISINEAAKGLKKIAENADRLDEFLTTWKTTGQNVSRAANSIDRFIRDNENDFKPAVASVRQFAQKANDTLDDQTQDSIKTALAHLASAAKRLDTDLAGLEPALKELGGPVNQSPVTDIGQAVRRINVLAADLELLTSKLRDGRGGLNAQGSLQKLLTRSDLHDNLNAMAISATQALGALKSVLANLRQFSERISRDPAALGRGVLDR